MTLLIGIKIPIYHETASLNNFCLYLSLIYLSHRLPYLLEPIPILRREAHHTTTRIVNAA